MKDEQTLLYNLWFFAENNLAAFTEDYEKRGGEEPNESVGDDLMAVVKVKDKDKDYYN